MVFFLVTFHAIFYIGPGIRLSLSHPHPHTSGEVMDTGHWSSSCMDAGNLNSSPHTWAGSTHPPSQLSRLCIMYTLEIQSVGNFTQYFQQFIVLNTVCIVPTGSKDITISTNYVGNQH